MTEKQKVGAWQAIRKSFREYFFPKDVVCEETKPLWFFVRRNIGGLPTSIGGRSKALSDRRNELLLGGGALYLLGYLTWALYSLINGIGFIPVLDAQYFAAGVVPGLLGCLFLLVITLLRAFDEWLKDPPTKTQIVISNVLSACTTVSAIIFAVSTVLPGNLKQTWAAFFTGGCLYLHALVRRNQGIRFFQGIVIWAARSYAILGLLLWAVYVERWMPLVPTEWGGAKSRCVLLDVDNAQLSPQTRSQIVGENSGANNDKAVRTKSLNLIFDGSEYFFFTEQSGRPSEKNPVYRLRKDVVKSVFQCPPPQPSASPVPPLDRKE